MQKQEDTKDKEIIIRYEKTERKFRMPLRHKFEEYKYMLEDLFHFESFARRLIFRHNSKPIESLQDINVRSELITGTVVIDLTTEEIGA